MQTPPPDPGKIGVLSQSVENCSTRIQNDSYDPKHWLERATYHLALNFPESAASDAYKASLLLDRTKIDFTPTRSKLHTVLGQALFDCHCHVEVADFWDEVAERYPSKQATFQAVSARDLTMRKAAAAAHLGGAPQEQKDRLRDGGILTVDYPWMHERHLARSSGVIRTINNELSYGALRPTCYFAQSSPSNRNEMLGIFAVRDIGAGENFLVDHTTTGACSSIDSNSCMNCFARILNTPIKSHCCSALYCSDTCRRLAMTIYHEPLCGQDFTWLQARAAGLTHNASPLRPLLILRFLAAGVQFGSGTHPLDHPLIARLQPLANAEHVDVFTFTESIVTPLKILEQLGIDIFANQRFDMITLQIIWARIANNKAGSKDAIWGFVDEITPHLPLFNHNCELNVDWRRKDGCSTIWFFAKRNTRAGEELFSSYVDVEGLGVEARIETLWPWFEGRCICEKCVREQN